MNTFETLWQRPFFISGWLLLYSQVLPFRLVKVLVRLAYSVFESQSLWNQKQWETGDRNYWRESEENVNFWVPKGI